MFIHSFIHSAKLFHLALCQQSPCPLLTAHEHLSWLQMYSVHFSLAKQSFLARDSMMDWPRKHALLTARCNQQARGRGLGFRKWGGWRRDSLGYFESQLSHQPEADHGQLTWHLWPSLCTSEIWHRQLGLPQMSSAKDPGWQWDISIDELASYHQLDDIISWYDIS